MRRSGRPSSLFQDLATRRPHHRFSGEEQNRGYVPVQGARGGRRANRVRREPARPIPARAAYAQMRNADWKETWDALRLLGTTVAMRDEPHQAKEKMPTGLGMLERARQHIGEDYVNVLVPKNNPNWRGPWDCAEFMSWLVYQEARILYGCIDDNSPPAVHWRLAAGFGSARDARLS
jgi:hypothetical protein